MIRVTVELIPYGIEERKQILGTAKIWNDATGTKAFGNYQFAIWGKRNRLIKEGEIKNFPRLKLLAWDLLYRVLVDAFGQRKEMK